MEYSNLTDQEILDLTNPSKNKGAIPLGAVQEKQKRKLSIFVNRDLNSHDFDKKGNFIK